MLTEHCGEHCGRTMLGGEAHCGHCHDQAIARASRHCPRCGDHHPRTVACAGREFWREHCRICENARAVPPPGLERMSWVIDFIQAHYSSGRIKTEAIIRLCPSTDHPHSSARWCSMLLNGARRIMALSWVWKRWARSAVWPKL